MVKKLLLFLTVLILDQWTKYLATTHLALGDPVPVIDGLFNFTLVYNPGAAFGMFGDFSDNWRRLILTVVSALALIVVVRFMFKEAKNDLVSQYALVAILGGAVGNVIDRYRFDSVVDFLDFFWGRYHWPAFNIADSAISVGVVVLMCRVLFVKHPAARPEETQPAS